MTSSRLWLAALLMVAVAVSTLAVRSRGPVPAEPPMVYAELPAFELVDQDGESFGRDTLRGKVWVANFIFTNCAQICPSLTTRMRDVQIRAEKWGDAIHLVSISVDPVRDTPERLRKYASQFEADPRTWSFLTGSIESIEKTVEKGFLMTMQEEEPDDTGFFNIVHGERFVLVDRAGRIRGYFEATDTGVEELLRTVEVLFDEPIEPEAETAPVVSKTS